MEGLEISIFQKSEILSDNVEFRLDSEYYQKEYISLYEKISCANKLGDIVTMTDLSTNGSFATLYAILNDGNPKTVPYIRSGNVGNTFIDESELEFISKEAHAQLPKSTTQLYDVIMARKGRIGGASLIMPRSC